MLARARRDARAIAALLRMMQSSNASTRRICGNRTLTGRECAGLKSIRRRCSIPDTEQAAAPRLGGLGQFRKPHAELAGFRLRFSNAALAFSSYRLRFDAAC